jgi:hypothetical protein
MRLLRGDYKWIGRNYFAARQLMFSAMLAIEILPPQPMGRGASMPDGYYSYSGFSFLASPRGELYLSLAAKVISFDIALDSSAVEEFDDRNRISSDMHRSSTAAFPRSTSPASATSHLQSTR